MASRLGAFWHGNTACTDREAFRPEQSLRHCLHDEQLGTTMWACKAGMGFCKSATAGLLTPELPCCPMQEEIIPTLRELGIGIVACAPTPSAAQELPAGISFWMQQWTCLRTHVLTQVFACMGAAGTAHLGEAC